MDNVHSLIPQVMADGSPLAEGVVWQLRWWMFGFGFGLLLCTLGAGVRLLKSMKGAVPEI